MRTHSLIIANAGGATALARKLGLKSGLVQNWIVRGSIPPKYWQALEEAGAATAQHLAETVNGKHAVKQSEGRSGARQRPGTNNETSGEPG